MTVSRWRSVLPTSFGAGREAFVTDFGTATPHCTSPGEGRSATIKRITAKYYTPATVKVN